MDRRLKNNAPTFQLYCEKGKITLFKLQKLSQLLSSLMHGHNLKSKHFIEHIRGYNIMFAFTSFGGHKSIKL